VLVPDQACASGTPHNRFTDLRDVAAQLRDQIVECDDAQSCIEALDNRYAPT